MRRLIYDRGFITGEDYMTDTHIVYQRLVGVLCHHDGRATREPRMCIGKVVAGIGVWVVVHSTSLTVVLLRLLAGWGGNHLYAGGNGIGGPTVVDSLHHEVAASVVECIRQVYGELRSCFHLREHQRAIVDDMHVSTCPWNISTNRLRHIASWHISHAELELRARLGLGRACANGKPQVGDGSRAVACLGHEGRVEDPLTHIVGIFRERNPLVVACSDEARCLDTRLLHTADTMVFDP